MDYKPDIYLSPLGIYTSCKRTTSIASNTI